MVASAYCRCSDTMLHSSAPCTSVIHTEAMFDPDACVNSHRITPAEHATGILTSFGAQATCKRFHAFCKENGVDLHNQGFQMSYKTSIPRSVGLSGSSAIVCAAMNCLIEYYGVSNR